jgi:F-type H+-transporting ATPase subunit alpha
MVATLNQPQYQPWPMEEQVIAIFAGINGYLDDIPVEDVPRFQEEQREFLRAEGTIYKEIRETGDLPDELAERLGKEIDKFKQGFNVSQEPELAGALT